MIFITKNHWEVFDVSFYSGFWSVLTWALYFLATHQDVQEKVYKEIKQVLGQDDVEPSTAKDLV